ncbi:hypothetical protein APL35_gp186 [Apis mellifera filamentous virus]|uniref:hypothetical protein n=1 Tax=Apis mellifera filamentous virus TaxID=1100043 RepID=UPI0006BCEE88|nr:hypothetical protein APL35_gp186 [Apis mellifera filamentous virus]
MIPITITVAITVTIDITIAVKIEITIATTVTIAIPITITITITTTISIMNKRDLIVVPIVLIVLPAGTTTVYSVGTRSTYCTTTALTTFASFSAFDIG